MSTATPHIENVVPLPGTDIPFFEVSFEYNTSIELFWLPTGLPASNYLVQFRQVGNPTWSTFGTVATTSALVTGLSTGTQYEFRVRANLGAFGSGPFSQVDTGETKTGAAFFNQGVFTAINLRGAINAQVVSLDDTNEIRLNGTPIATLNAGGTASFVSNNIGDILDADGAFFAAGEVGSDNYIFARPEWSGKEFIVNATRNNPITFFVYAHEAATVDLFQGPTLQDTITLAAGASGTLTTNTINGFQVLSTGIVSVYSTASGSGGYDQKPSINPSQRVIGFPSQSGQITPLVDGVSYTGVHSNSAVISGTVNRNAIASISPQGSSTSLYQCESIEVIGSSKIGVASFADTNGTKSAPFLPISQMRTRYAVNVDSDYVAFASLESGTIDVVSPAGTVIDTLTLTRSGGNADAPYRARRGTTTAGTRFLSTAPVAGFYQPNTSTNAGNQDETILIGWN